MFFYRKKTSNEVNIVTSRLANSVELASIYRSKYQPGRTNITKEHQILQLAVIGFSYKDYVNAHFHHPLPRKTLGTSECWIVTRANLKLSH
jgi:hypothetical protein